MRMIVAALIGGIVLGFVDAKFLADEIHRIVTDPGSQGIATAGVAAFLGALWGWIAKGLFGSRAKD